jgi:predicted protein tyrosine phosphatase
LDYNLITTEPLKPDWGLLYQGNWIDNELWKLPTPIFVVQMDEDHCDHRSINHARGYIGVLSLSLGDVPENLPHDATGNAIGPLPYAELEAATETVVAYLERGVNVYIHCAWGLSRSSYLTLAVLMRVTGQTLADCLTLLRSQRPAANPNSGFLAHLAAVEDRLRCA